MPAVPAGDFRAAMRQLSGGVSVITTGCGDDISGMTVTSVASEYGKTPAQVLLRWNLQLGNAVIFRSTNAERIASNLDVFDFELAAEHMDAINGLNDGTRVREDPLTYAGT